MGSSRTLILFFVSALAMFGQSHCIQLNWTQSTSCPANPLETVNVYSSTTSGGEVMGKPTYTGIPCTTTSYLDLLANLIPGTPYYFKVTEFDLLSGESAFSNEATATFPLPPSAPNPLSAKPI